MISQWLDATIAAFSPHAGVRRQQARKILRTYQGAETNRLTSGKRPLNQSADQEALGPSGADSLRAWARMLVRDNAYAWGVVDTIVSSVIGTGIRAQSMYESKSGADKEKLNRARDRIWDEWCEVCDITGQFNFNEVQAIVQREIVEAGEVLIHLVDVPKRHDGILRPVPFALEIIEADRLASDKDTYTITRDSTEMKIIRGVEIDRAGRPVAYWVYPDHPNAPYSFNRTPIRLAAKNVVHLFRRDRVGQSRGISWFAPVLSWLRDLGIYVDNEIQASAVASCFTVAVKTETPISSMQPPTDYDTTDADGNQYEFLQPGMVMNLRPNESIESANPSRPNAQAGPWINLMLRGIAVGTGLSYEIVARDYSQTNYSSNRASQLEDRRRFRRWQQYLIAHLCQPVWDRFVEAAAMAGNKAFPEMHEILGDRRRCACVEWQPQSWEWVDPATEQAAAENSVRAFQSTYQDELAGKGANWRSVFRQRAKEEAMLKKLGLVSPAQETEADATATKKEADASMITAKKSGEEAKPPEAEAKPEPQQNGAPKKPFELPAKQEATQRCVLPTSDGELVEVQAEDAGIPGLVIHRSLDNDGWAITHASTGIALSVEEDIQTVKAIAKRIERIPVAWDRVHTASQFGTMNRDTQRQLLTAITIARADTCGAGSGSPKGFGKGNTCAVGGKGDGGTGSKTSKQDQQQAEDKLIGKPGDPIKDPYTPDVEHDEDGDGVTDSARVGVPAFSTPPPPKIPRLPNLTKKERAVESRFAEQYEKDPQGFVDDYTEMVMAKAKAKGEPPTFETDGVKDLSPDWNHDDLDKRMVLRHTNNTALHGTANAAAKHAFTQHLDTLKKGDMVLVTVGGCGAGKGYAMGADGDGKPFVPEAYGLKGKAKAVWDSAGDQNATENPWVLKELKKRGLKASYVFVHADPQVAWDSGFGVVARAHKKDNGRMVDSHVFADSYALGAKNHQAFYEKHKNDKDINFMFLENGKVPKKLDGIPPEALKIDRKKLRQFASDTIRKRPNTMASVLKGALSGDRIWGL